MDSDSTSLDALLPSPQGNQSAPPLIPMPSSEQTTQGSMVPSFKPSLPAMGFMFRNLRLYFCFFVAAAVVSLSTPRNMLLQYLPSMYTSGGVVSWQGAGVLGAAAVVIAHLLSVFLGSLGI